MLRPAQCLRRPWLWKTSYLRGKLRAIKLPACRRAPARYARGASIRGCGPVVPSSLRRLRSESSGSRCWMESISSSRSRSSSETTMFSLLSDAVEDQRSLHLVHRLVALRGTQAVEVQRAHRISRHALLGEGTKTALQASIDLLLHERSQAQGTGTSQSVRRPSGRARRLR